jgi:hypothetical protein
MRPRSIDDDAVGDVEHEVEVLLDDDEREPVALAQAGEDLADLLHDRRLDAFRRLVEQEQPRRGDERAAEREDLLLAARERAALAVEERRSRGSVSRTRSIAAGSVSPESAVHARRRFSSAVRPGRMPRPCGT